MTRKETIATFAIIGLACVSTCFGAQNVLSNGSMELGDGSVVTYEDQPAHWARYGNTIERSGGMNLVPAEGGFALKAFSGSNETGAYQDIAVVAGDMVTISASLYTMSTDQISGDAQAGLKLEFLDENYGLLGTETTFVLTEESPADTWIPASIGPIEVPSGATIARIVCVWQWFESAGGAGFWDDAQLSINGGANQVLNGDFELAHTIEVNPFGIANWTGFNDQGKSQDESYHGISSVRMGMTADYSGVFQDFGIVQAGDRILVKAKAYQPSTAPLESGDRVGLKLEFATTEALPAVENLPFDQTATPNVWQQIDISTNGLEVPEGVYGARIVMLYMGDDDTTGSIHFDSAHAEVDSSPGTNLLLNPSFEDGIGGDNGIDDWTEFNTPGLSWAQMSAFEVTPHDGFTTMKAYGTTWAGIWQEIAVTPGDELSVSAQLMTSSTDQFVSSTGFAGVKVEWMAPPIPGNVDIGASRRRQHRR